MLSVALPISIGVSVAALSAAGACLSIERLRKYLNPDIQQTYLSDTLDFHELHEDGLTLVGREGSLTRTFILEGMDYGLCKEEDIIKLLKRRGLFLDKVIAKESVYFRVITRRVPLEARYDGHYDNVYLQKIHDKWQSQFKKIYRYEHYVILSMNPSFSAKNLVTLGKKSPVEKGKFDELCDRVKSSLAPFGVKSLSGGTGDKSPLLSFWSSLINSKEKEISCVSHDLAEHMALSSVEFDWKKGRIHFFDGVSRRIGVILSTQNWGDQTTSKFFRELLRIEGEITFLHLVKGVPKQKALDVLRDKERDGSGVFSPLTDNAAHEVETARQILQDDAGSMHSYQFSMIIVADSEEELLPLIAEADETFSSYGAECVVETQAIEYIWRSQFPGHETFVRKSTLFSSNLSHIFTFDKEPQGTINSDWGKGPLRNFKTINGGAFPLNLHVSDKEDAVAHTLIIAPIGSGKTMLSQHLMAGALRHPDLRAYIFDRYNGTRIFTESCGGEYIDMSKKSGVKLNPFLVENSVVNQSQIRDLLKLMSNVEDVPTSEINSIVDMLLNLEPSKRLLKNISSSLLKKDGVLTEPLENWATGSHSHWFNGEMDGKAYDSLDLESKRLIGFEMTDILKQQDIVAPLVFSIMERILSVIRSNRCPSWVFIDEAAAMLKVPYFRNYVEMLLLEMRKLRGAVSLCFQDASSLQKTGIAQIILGQCQTKLIFPNPSAKREDYDGFDLNDSEWDYIMGNNDIAKELDHTVLLKKPNESAILNIDLSPLGSLMNLYLSGKDRVITMKNIQKTGGDQWVDTYLKA